MRLPLLCVVALLTLTGCGADAPRAERGVDSVQEGTSTVESGAPCVPAPEVSAPLPASYPASLALPRGAVVTSVGRQGGFDLVSGRVEAPAEDVLDHFRDAAEPAGFAIVRDEDEGRAGQLQLFGPSRELGITVAQLTCPRGSSGFTLRTQAP